MIELDDVLRVIDWNRRAERVFGVSAATAIGRTIAELVPVVDDPDVWSQTLVADSEAPRVRRVAGRDEELRFEAWSQVTRGADGRVVGATIYGHDVTAREREHQRLVFDST